MSPMFDPKKTRETSNQGIPPGDYLVAMTKLERRLSKTDRWYLLCWFVVVAGAARGKKFKDIVSLDTDNEGSAFRLALLMEGCGQVSAIDLDDAAAMSEALVGKPFKVRLKRTTENGYTNNGIERYLIGKDVTDADRDAMDQWQLDREAAGDYEGSVGGDDRDVPPPVDDDIPF